MGFFKDLREDISQAVNELLPDDSFWGLEEEESTEELKAESETIEQEVEKLNEQDLTDSDNFESDEEEILAELQKLVSPEADENETVQESMDSGFESLGLEDIAKHLVSDEEKGNGEQNLEKNIAEDDYAEAFKDAKSLLDMLPEDTTEDVSFEIFEKDNTLEEKDNFSAEEVQEETENVNAVEDVSEVSQISDVFGDVEKATELSEQEIEKASAEELVEADTDTIEELSTGEVVEEEKEVTASEIANNYDTLEEEPLISDTISEADIKTEENDELNEQVEDVDQENILQEHLTQASEVDIEEEEILQDTVSFEVTEEEMQNDEASLEETEEVVQDVETTSEEFETSLEEIDELVENLEETSEEDETSEEIDESVKDTEEAVEEADETLNEFDADTEVFDNILESSEPEETQEENDVLPEVNLGEEHADIGNNEITNIDENEDIQEGKDMDNMEGLNLTDDFAASTMDVQENATILENITEKEVDTMENNLANAEVKDEVTVITKGTVINGSISSDGSLEVNGTITGDVECLGKLSINGNVSGHLKAAEVVVSTPRLDGGIESHGDVKVGVGTIVLGDVSAKSATISGAVKGEIDVNGPVVVDSTAIVKGNITAKSVQINNGAVVDGYCKLSYAEVDIDNFFEEN